MHWQLAHVRGIESQNGGESDFNSWKRIPIFSVEHSQDITIFSCYCHVLNDIQAQDHASDHVVANRGARKRKNVGMRSRAPLLTLHCFLFFFTVGGGMLQETESRASSVRLLRRRNATARVGWTSGSATCNETGTGFLSGSDGEVGHQTMVFRTIRFHGRCG